MAAYAAGSGRIDMLAPEQQQRAAGHGGLGAVGSAYGALLPHKGDTAGSSSSDAVVLVSQNGSIFGVPTARLTFDAARDGAAAVVAAGSGDQCQVPREQRLDEDGSNNGRALALLLQPSPPLAGSVHGSAMQCKPAEQDVCSASHLGVYPVQHTCSSSLLLLPPGANESALEAAQQQQQQGGMRSLRRSWLVLLAGVGFGATASAGVLYVAMRNRQQAAGKAATVLQQHVAARADGSATVSLDASTGGKGRRRRPAVSGRQGQQMSNRLKGLMQQAASDMPVHAVAFPEGAQQQSHRQHPMVQQNRRLDETLPSSAAVAAGLTDPSMRRREVKDGVILVGRMRVRWFPGRCHGSRHQG